MSDPLITAIIAASATLVVALLNSIAAEVFRRNRDRKVIAAAIAGELASYELALPLIRDVLQAAINALDMNNREIIIFRPFEKPKDVVFEKVIEKLGLLGPKLVEDSVYVYGNLNGFRVSFGLISMHFEEMSDSELRERSIACLAALNRAAERGTPLIEKLRCIAGI